MVALIQDEPTVMPPIGSDTIDTPCHAMRPAAMNWPASFVVQSRSQMSSATPMSTMSRAAPRMASICVGFWKMIETTENREEPRFDTNAAAAIAARMPTNIAMPPSRGVGRVCTSRSRIFG